MATACSTSPKSIKKPIQLNKSNLDDVRRLSTFSAIEEDIHRTLTKGLLAKLGFSYISARNTIKCDGCDFESNLSVSDRDLVDAHMNESPECVFVSKRKDILLDRKYHFHSGTNNIESFFFLNIYLDQPSLSLISNNLSMSNVNSNLQNNTNQNVNSRQSNTNPQRAFLDLLSHEARDKLREYTFLNWPLITPNVSDMVAAGWSYTNIADRVICIHCDALFHKWTESDRPYEIHCLKSPECPFVRMAKQKPRESSNSSKPIVTDPTTQVAVDAVNPNFLLSTRRYDSFKTWPHTEKDPLPSIQLFVDAGFFYTGWFLFFVIPYSK